MVALENLVCLYCGIFRRCEHPDSQIINSFDSSLNKRSFKGRSAVTEIALFFVLYLYDITVEIWTLDRELST